jgi:hypothetical protein
VGYALILIGEKMVGGKSAVDAVLIRTLIMGRGKSNVRKSE